MRKNKMKLIATLLAASLIAASFTGCAKSDTDTENKPTPPAWESFPEGTFPGETLPGEGLPEDMGDSALAFRPSELGLLSSEEYDFPYIGMRAALPKTLRDLMDSRDVILMTKEEYTTDAHVKYAALSLYSLTEEQKNEVVTAFDPQVWEAGLAKIGVLGVYHKDSISELDSLTGCTVHKELGKSTDGTYVYYLSTFTEADEALVKEFEKTEVTITEMLELDFFMGKTAFSEARIDASHIGDFKTTDINGADYTSEFFKEYDLTLVNVFTTWCSACLDEMPELEKLKNEMAAKGVGVVGIVHDTVNDGVVNEEAIETAKLFMEKAKLTLPLLLPDETLMNGRLQGIDGVPETFFVDRDGNIVGETYIGAKTFEEWKEIVEKELEALK